MLLPTVPEADVPGDRQEPTEQAQLVRELTAERRLVFASGGRGAKVGRMHNPCGVSRASDDRQKCTYYMSALATLCLTQFTCLNCRVLHFERTYE